MHSLLLAACLLIFFVFSYADLYAGEPLFWGFALDGYPVTEQKLKNVEDETGLSSDIVVFYLQWPSPEDMNKNHFPRKSLETIWNAGAVPCITWEPMYYKNNDEIAIPYSEILKGNYDAYMLAFADQVKSWGKPLMMRFAHEMNIERYHWGTDKQGYGPESPEIYKQMFRYVVSFFKKAGVKNILWVFCPNAESVPAVSYDKSAAWNQIENYYPGEAYVDILGIDGYNWGTTQKKATHGWDSQWKSFKEIFRGTHEKLLYISSYKPIIIFETASVNKGGDKTIWINDALDTAIDWNLKGIVWFQTNKELDWRINSEEEHTYRGLVRQRTSHVQRWLDCLSKKVFK
jgi:hypothetical protein